MYGLLEVSAWNGVGKEVNAAEKVGAVEGKDFDAAVATVAGSVVIFCVLDSNPCLQLDLVKKKKKLYPQ